MKRIWSNFFFFSIRYRYILWCIGILLISIGIGGVIRSNYSSDMRLLLPENSQSVKSLNAVINSGTANKITLYVSRQDGNVLDNSDDMRMLAVFSEKLRTINGVTQVVCSAFDGSVEDIYRDFISHYPLLYHPSQLPKDNILSLYLQERFKTLYLNPITGTMQYRYDPFNWTTKCFSEYENILKVSGTRFYPGNKSFIFSPDRKKCMILIYTDIAVTDYQKSATLVNDLQKLSLTLPSHINCDFFSPHMHILENAKIMKTDLQIFAFCTLIIFAMLFAFVYKFDWRGILIPVIASCGGLFATAAMGLFFETTMLFVIAMGGVLIGIAGDYGIHLYAAGLSNRKVQNIIALYPSLCIAFFTTSIAFLCFVFSEVPAFIQFGVYSFCTLLFAFLLLLFLLPGILFCYKHRSGTLDFFHLFRLCKISSKHMIVALFLLCILIIGVFYVKFDTDIRKFDIAYETLAEKEKIYQQSFTSGEYPYVLFYTSESFDEMLNQCQKDKIKLKTKFPAIKMVTPADFFTMENEKKSNLQAWQKYISSGEWQEYKKMFYIQVASQGVDKEFFSFFFTELEKSVLNPPKNNPKLQEFAYKNMLGKTSTHWTGIAMIDKKTIANQDLLKNTSAIVISEETFAEQLFKDIIGKLPIILPLAVIVIVLSVFISLRSLTKTCLVFLPVMACLIGICGMHGLLNQEITLAVIVAGIITIGISVDYGIIMIDSSLDPHLFNAITFSTITTAAGGLTVLFTTHPMLRAAGLTIVAGILSTCLFCFCILYPILKKINAKKILLLLSVCAITVCCVSGCNAFPQAQILPIKSGASTINCVYPTLRANEFQGSLVLDYKVGQITFIIAGKVSENGMGHFSGFSPGGIRLFSLMGNGFELEDFSWQRSTVPPKKQLELSRFLYHAISSNLYVPYKVTGVRYDSSNDYVAITKCFVRGDRLTCLYSGAECVIAKKEYDGKYNWVVKYCERQTNTDSEYIFSEGSIFQAYVKMKFL